jgi:hypothetical protein
MVFAIEPMVNIGGNNNGQGRQLDSGYNGWELSAFRAYDSGAARRPMGSFEEIGVRHGCCRRVFENSGYGEDS